MAVSIDCPIETDTVDYGVCSMWSLAQNLTKQWNEEEAVPSEGRVSDNKTTGQYVKLLVSQNVVRKRKRSYKRINRTVRDKEKEYHQSSSRTVQNQ